VLINTLRRDGPRLRWINDAVVRLAEIGGPALMRDILSPLIMNEAWQAENRASCLTDDDYVPIDQTCGTYNLLVNAKSADWNVEYEKLTQPTLVITGKQDRIFNDRDDVTRLFARLPNATRMDVDNAGHMVPIEQVDELARALLDFAPKCMAA
jgi:pimeloyl-ACP methyl ester carboxylesterase